MYQRRRAIQEAEEYQERVLGRVSRLSMDELRQEEATTRRQSTVQNDNFSNGSDVLGDDVGGMPATTGAVAAAHNGTTVRRSRSADPYQGADEIVGVTAKQQSAPDVTVVVSDGATVATTEDGGKEGRPAPAPAVRTLADGTAMVD